MRNSFTESFGTAQITDLFIGAMVESFTQNQLQAGDIQYIHTSSDERTQDNFVFSLSDGINSVSALRIQ